MKPRHNTAAEWADKIDRFPTDTKLRRHGYVIAGRPIDGPAIWRLGPQTYTEAEALILIAVELALAEEMAKS